MMAYANEVEALRKEKDHFFRGDPDSPLPAERRGSFDGLRYFPPDEAWRVQGRWEPHKGDETLTLQTTTGEIRDYRRAGHIVFQRDGHERRLTGFVPATGHTHALFVPFRDRTSGKATYGTGRYLDLPLPEGPEEMVVDFNLAYNPWCAYDERYSCPLTPPENALDLEVTAGERTPA